MAYVRLFWISHRLYGAIKGNTIIKFWRKKKIQKWLQCLKCIKILMPYVYHFCQIFLALRLFTALRLFRSAE